MKFRSIEFVILAAVAGMLPVTAAQAQWYSSYTQAPYAVSPDKPYAVEVAPDTYVIHRPGKRHAGPRVEQPENEPPRTHANRALIEELVKRHKTKTIDTTKVVREKPVVIEHEHVVDDPPRVIERRHITEDAPGRGLIRHRREVATEDVVVEPGGAPPKHAAKGRRAVRQAKTEESGGKRVIKADAEVTILGPDRMSIRLFRKGRGGKDANAEVVE